MKACPVIYLAGLFFVKNNFKNMTPETVDKALNAIHNRIDKANAEISAVEKRTGTLESDMRVAGVHKEYIQEQFAELQDQLKEISGAIKIFGIAACVGFFSAIFVFIVKGGMSGVVG